MRTLPDYRVFRLAISSRLKKNPVLINDQNEVNNVTLVNRRFFLGGGDPVPWLRETPSELNISCVSVSLKKNIA